MVTKALEIEGGVYGILAIVIAIWVGVGNIIVIVVGYYIAI